MFHEAARLCHGRCGGSDLTADDHADNVADYADRLDIQAENAARLDELNQPRIELPDLNPPVEAGELNELAALFTRDAVTPDAVTWDADR